MKQNSKIYSLIFAGAIIGGGVGSQLFNNLIWGVVGGAMIGCVVAVIWANKTPKNKVSQNKFFKEIPPKEK